ncbi:MAG: DUF805 domain-containing protein [Parvularculaceae bacterium]|nr:DUF805 domain-containing protein [Parvularculaceae bacterium]
MTPREALTFYFSPNGRISRRGLALGVLLPMVAVLALIDVTNSPVASTLIWLVIGWPLLVATPWKRLQDMGRSGRWNVIFLAFYALGFLFFLGEYAAAEGGWSSFFDGVAPTTVDNDLTANGLGGFSTILIFLPIHLFWLYLIPGAHGDNRYGPAPRP